MAKNIKTGDAMIDKVAKDQQKLNKAAAAASRKIANAAKRAARTVKGSV